MLGKDHFNKKRSSAIRHLFLFLVFTTFIFALSSWNAEQEIQQTPYVLKYPPYFGNRINITEDNPLTEEGVALGRKLFYETRLSANTLLRKLPHAGKGFYGWKEIKPRC